MTSRRSHGWLQAAEGWQRPDHNRAFRVEHWYYDRQQIDGWDYDIGAQRVRTATAANQAAPLELITAWGLQPTDFTRAWNTADPWVRGSGPRRPNRDQYGQGEQHEQ